MRISRRELFRHFGQSAVCLAVSDFIGLKAALGQSAGGSLSQEPEVDYRKWEDLYRKEWTWDKIVHSTHAVGCMAQCEWNVFVKDGVAFKEEQIEHPRSTNPEDPDPGPQGCQRGACYTNVMYAPGRLKYPLRRIGKRGEGKWMRISWDEALTEAADALLDAMAKDGPRSIIIDLGDETGHIWKQFYSMIGSLQPDYPVSTGDDSMGYYSMTGYFPMFGSGLIKGAPANGSLFDADLIFIWHWNPIQTFIPYYKQFSQARYRGAQIVTVAPDMSPSTVHADYWIPVEPGTDIALALGMCQVIVEEKLYKPAFLKEQTDLPFLVREDTQKFLRETDLESGGRDDQFYIYDLKAKKVVPAKKDSLELGQVDPALEGRYEVQLSDGKKMRVRPVFDRLKEMLNKDYKPEQAAEIISKPFAKVHPDMIREVARKAGKAKSMVVTTRNNTMKCYHGDLIERSIGLFLMLSGHARAGGYPGNFRYERLGKAVEWEAFKHMERPDVEAGVEAFNKKKAQVEEVMRKDSTMTFAMAQRELDSQEGKQGYIVPGWQWMYYRAGFKDRWNNKQWHDPHYRSFSSYVEEANKEGWFDGYIGPDKEKVPVRDRVLISAGGNYLRRFPGTEVFLNDYTPSLEKIIKVDTRISSSTMYADLVLPCAGYYEYTTIRQRNCFLMDKAVDPLGEAKPDWDIVCLLAKKISERAKARAMTKVYDSRRDITVDLDKLYDRLTINGAYKEGDGEKLADLMYQVLGKLGFLPEGLTLEQVRKSNGIPPSAPKRPGDAGLTAVEGLGGGAGLSGEGGADTAKLPHPTLTRRMQFYLDHDWYMEAGEALPVHRPHPLLGGDYPFHQTGGHGRESIHTMWIANPLILRLTRGVPSLLMNKEAAERMGIEDYEEVEVYNDAGLYRVRVKHSSLVRPNQVVIYHCWEKYQLSKGHWQAVNPAVAKPLLLSGGYGHLTYCASGGWQPETARRGGRIDIRKISA
jgi:steroid C-25 hydroxylase alpha subunit